MPSVETLQRAAGRPPPSSIFLRTTCTSLMGAWAVMWRAPPAETRAATFAAAPSAEPAMGFALVTATLGAVAPNAGPACGSALAFAASRDTTVLTAAGAGGGAGAG